MNAAGIGRVLWGRDRTVVLGHRHIQRSDLLLGGLEHVLRERISAEPRLDPTSGRGAEAEAEWWSAVEAVVDVLADHDAGTNSVIHTVTGSGPMLNANSIVLCQELRRTALGGLSVVDTTAPPERQERHLEPDSNGRPRLLVVILAAARPYPIDRHPVELLELAVRSGWRPLEEVGLPDGGRVVILAHPHSPPVIHPVIDE